MLRRKKSKMEVLAGLLEIPDDLVFDLPRITLLGNQQLLVENHKGIIEYTAQQVRIQLTQGTLGVTGQNLTLGSLQAEQILIEGTIQALRYDL